jgi:hypothetical protein
MALPLPGATHLPPNKFATPIVESLDGYADSVAEAQAIGEYLKTLPVIFTAPITPGPLDDKWQAAEDKRDADIERRERWRNRALGRQQAAIRAANALLHNNLDHLLNRLHLHLVDVLLTATPDMTALVTAGVDNADQAIEHELVAEWARLQQSTWHDYELLRSSQEFLMLNIASDTIWRTATPSFDGEPPASLLWLKNLPELWTDWRERGRTRPTFTIQGDPPRPEPWPRPNGPEFLLWAFKAGAQHWIPATREFREEFSNRQHEITNTDDEPQDDETRDNNSARSFPGLPPPIMAQQ